VTAQNDAAERSRIDLVIHIGLAILLATACWLILRPFVPLLTWGIIIAVAAYPSFKRLRAALGGRGTLAAVIFSLVLLILLIVPVMLLAGTLVEGVHTMATHFREGTLVIPPPAASVEHWPIIGAPVNKLWSLAATDLGQALRSFAPQIKAVMLSVITASAGFGFTMLQFLLSILVAGALLAKSEAAYSVTCLLAKRLFGKRGPEFQQLMGSTIHSVTTGILGVAFIQSVLAGLGFLVVGLPGAGLWAVVFLIAAVLQVGNLVLIPAVVYVFAVSTITKAVIFLIWCVIVGLGDNVLKPILLGRGVAVPIIVVFLGAIGGFITLGIIGLFVGAIVLSVGYKLFLAWIYEGSPANQEA
jgi:predicted PurR-regulated permease PerM